jgi:ABC-type transport system involved in multi-copper enzyme maturation permease subunit
MMTETQRTSGSGLRIILAIAWKDILDSLKNRVMIGIMIGVATLMVGAFAMRMLVGMSDQPRVGFAGPSGRELVRDLRRETEFPAFALEDQMALEVELGQSFAPALGVLLPDELPPSVAADGTLELTGYYPYWIDPEVVRDTFESVERLLSEMWGATVTISYAGNAVYPTLESTGQMVMVATGLVNALFIIGVYMTPGLIQEEKQTGTFSTLLVSPASMTHIAVGKSLAGLAYCLAAAAVFCLMAAGLIVHWSVIVIAVLAGSAFAVVLGLVIGTFSDEPASMNLWLGLLLVVLLLPVFVGQFASNLPAWLATVFSLLPTVALSEMVCMSMTASIDWPRLTVDLLRMFIPTLLLLGLSIWGIRRREV